jgi:type III pantothenate kinase
MASENYNLCIDCGNTRTKVGVFRSDALIFTEVYTILGISELIDLKKKFSFSACILSNVSAENVEIEKYLEKEFPFFILLNEKTKLPVKNLYEQPETLGKDRIAAVVGAVSLKPESDLLVIDAGTAITYDFVDADSVFHGGNIAPGIRMRSKALHAFTKRLPEVEPSENFGLLGKNTNSALLNGVMNGVVFEINGYFDALKIKYPELSIFLTGGDANYFVSTLKSPIFAEKYLVLIGLNRILQFNVKN